MNNASGFDLLEQQSRRYKNCLADGLFDGTYRYNDDGELEKLCMDCNEYWPADSEFFLNVAQATDKLSLSCRACITEGRRK